MYGVEVRDVSGLPGGPDTNELAEKIATVPSEKFLGLFRGVVYEFRNLDQVRCQLGHVERKPSRGEESANSRPLAPVEADRLARAGIGR